MHLYKSIHSKDYQWLRRQPYGQLVWRQHTFGWKAALISSIVSYKCNALFYFCYLLVKESRVIQLQHFNIFPIYVRPVCSSSGVKDQLNKKTKKKNGILVFNLFSTWENKGTQFFFYGLISYQTWRQSSLSLFLFELI